MTSKNFYQVVNLIGFIIQVEPRFIEESFVLVIKTLRSRLRENEYYSYAFFDSFFTCCPSLIALKKLVPVIYVIVGSSSNYLKLCGLYWLKVIPVDYEYSKMIVHSKIWTALKLAKRSSSDKDVRTRACRIINTIYYSYHLNALMSNLKI